jgi:hypothetical protein
LLLDSQLSGEERLARDSVRDYCQRQFMPGVIEANRHESFDQGIHHVHTLILGRAQTGLQAFSC